MWHQHYADLNYEKGFAAWFMKQSHKWSEQRYSEGDHFPIVLEVSAGTGIHIQHLKHSFGKYFIYNNPKYSNELLIRGYELIYTHNGGIEGLETLIFRK